MAAIVAGLSNMVLLYPRGGRGRQEQVLELMTAQPCYTNVFKVANDPMRCTHSAGQQQFTANAIYSTSINLLFR